jgi:DNA-binding GntR family transcriptional regulator
MKLSRSASLRERIADELRGEILRQDFPPGMELKQDQLAERFGVSRIPVREALLMLERDGLVTVSQNRRMVVTKLTNDDLLDHYAVRALIEGEAAARAAGRPPERLTDIVAAGRRNVEALEAGDRAAFLTSSEVFHRAVWTAGGGSYLQKLASDLWSGRDYVPAYPEQLRRACEDHGTIAAAIIKGEIDVAREAMVAHINQTADELLAYREQLVASQETRDYNGAKHDRS